ncbi:MAG: hypothetical protein HFE74_00475 [Firmicutes bacterium]|jgi:hypothetical protein|nr:hypothetical protein [Bacillota bacterium]
MKEMTFKNIFFRLYDKKISDGTITFSQLGISKMDFTRLCMEENFVLDEETIIRISDTMNLTEEEKDELLKAAERS